MVFISTQVKKLKFILFPPSKFPGSSKVSIFPDYKCYTRKNNLSPSTNKRKYDDSNKNDFINTSGTTIAHQQQQDLYSPIKEETSIKDIQEQNTTLTKDPITNTETSTLFTQRNYCPTLISPSLSSSAEDNNNILLASIVEKNNTSSEFVHQPPIYDHPNEHDKRELFSALKRFLQPHKTYYELEWTIPNYANATSSKVWLQLDKQTSSGIERVRRLGFADLDVRLDDNLTRFINDSILVNKRVENILIEILFSSGNYHDNRKDSVPQPSTNKIEWKNDSHNNNVHLLRLRRAPRWTKDYTLARACLP